MAEKETERGERSRKRRERQNEERKERDSKNVAITRERRKTGRHENIRKVKGELKRDE